VSQKKGGRLYVWDKVDNGGPIFLSFLLLNS